VTLRDTEWMDRAACSLDPNWTATIDYYGINNRERETMPDRCVLARLAAICASCPVFKKCAHYALSSRSDGGMYAGVWIPLSRNGARGHVNPAWIQARELLRERAAS